MSFLFFLLPLFSFCTLGLSNNENKLKNILLKDYESDTIPRFNQTPVQLKLGIALRAFNNINQIDGTITSNIWLRHWWNDYQLRWNEKDWNISKISLNTNLDSNRPIWTPDIYIYNTAENPLQDLHYSRAIVYSNGNIIWSRPGMMTSTCVFDLSNFPYDQQICNFKFGSWTYHGKELNLSMRQNENVDKTNYQENDGWELIETNAKLDERIYKCCPEPYQSIYYTFKLRRKPGFFVLNIIIPTFATATLMILSLLIPWDSGERISFAITVMLSIIVFLLILSESLPKTNTKPLLSKMLIGLVFFSLFVVFFTVTISTIHSYSKKNKNFCRKLLNLFDKCNLTCKKDRPLNRTNSYINGVDNPDILENNPDNQEDKKKDEELCDRMADILEKIFTSLFFMAFIIYCSVVFTQKPNY